MQGESREIRSSRHSVSNMPKRGSSRPVSVRMATDALTMASRESKSVIPCETWQRVNHAREFIVVQQVFLDFLR